MTQMSNIVVKSSSGADVTFGAITGSAGDGVPALWRVADPDKAPAKQTSLTLSARDTADKKGRRSVLSFNAFYAQTVNGITTESRVPMKVEVVTPLTMPASAALDYVTVALNTAGAALVQQSMGTGYAPRG